MVREDFPPPFPPRLGSSVLSEVDCFAYVRSSNLLKYPIMWLFFGSVILLSIKGLRCASREFLDIKNCWTRRDRGVGGPKEKEIHQLKEKLQDEGWLVPFMSTVLLLHASYDY